MSLVDDLKKKAPVFKFDEYARWALVILLAVFALLAAAVVGIILVAPDSAARTVQSLLKHFYLHYGLIPVLVLLILVTVAGVAFIAQLIATAFLFKKAYLEKGEKSAEVGKTGNSPQPQEGAFLKKENWRFIAVLAVSNAAVALLLVWAAVYSLGYIGLEIAEQPEFCTVCHNMKPAYKTYEESSHAGIPCGECHNAPGMKGFAKGEVYAPAKEGWLYAAGEYDKKPMIVHLENASCLREECHKKKRLAEKEFRHKTLVFKHANHLETKHAGEELCCSACHTGSKEKHMGLNYGVCALCHFNSKYKLAERLSCESCHATRPELKGTVELLHREKVDLPRRPCSDCHEVKREEISIDASNCLKCHEEKVERLNSEKAHSIHNAVRCLECHTAPKHAIGTEKFQGEVLRPFGKEFSHGKHAAVSCAACHAEEKAHYAMTLRSAADCAACHHKDEKKNCADCHKTQQSLFDGEPMFGFAKKPSAKSEAGMSCDACHGDMKNYLPDYLKKSCTDCHDIKEDAYNLDRIKENAAKLMNEAKTLGEKASVSLQSARKENRTGPAIGEAEKLTNEALKMINSTEKDGSLSLHNPSLWNEVVKDSIEKLKKALQLLQEKR
jgi:hypothetical protein